MNKVRSGWLVIFALLVLAGCSSSSDPVAGSALAPFATPTPSPLSGLLYTTADHALWLVDARGEPRQLAARPEGLRSPAVSLAPDRTLALYNDSQFCRVVDVDTGTVEQIVELSEASDLLLTCRWSLEGQEIYYTDGMDLWAVAQQGAGTRRNLTKTPDRFEERLLLPHQVNSGWLLFYSWSAEEMPDGVGWRGALTTVRSDGTEYRIVAEAPGSDVPVFSPDGQTLAYVEWDDLWFYRPDGEARRIDFSAYGLGSGKVRFTSPAWSPDGTQIAGWAKGRRNGEAFYGLLLLDLETQTSRILAPLHHPRYWDSHPPAPEWSPDGRWLVYWGQDEAGEQLGVWAIAADGWMVHSLAAEDDSETICPAPWDPGKRFWSPDGKWLAFSRCERRTDAENLNRGIWIAEVGQWEPVRTDLPSDARAAGWVTFAP